MLVKTYYALTLLCQLTTLCICILYCHYPFLMRGCVNHDFPQDLHRAISKLYAFVHWITSKDIHMDRIPWWNQEIVEIACMFENELPASFMHLRVHILIHLPDKVELVGLVSCHWMLFLERSMNKLKGFVRQMAKLEGSMVEGYIVYESFYYLNE